MANILIVDDEIAIRTTLAKILEDERHKATVCESGEEALAQFAREEFDLVILDLWLPGVDGMAVLERVRAVGGPPVIVISGHGNIDTAVRATRLGAYDFLEKPLSLERVVLTVNHALADSRLRVKGRFIKRSEQEQLALRQMHLLGCGMDDIDEEDELSSPPDDDSMPDVNDPEAGFCPTEDQPYRRFRRHTVT